MKDNKVISILAFLLIATTTLAFEQKEIAVRSNSMDKDILCSVITPEGYSTQQSYPVIYLLHGHGGNHTVWTKDGAVAAE